MPDHLPLELLSTAEMAEADKAAIRSGIPGAVLMQHAGAAVAKSALRLLMARRVRAGKVAIFCGPGNNGGDGFVAAQQLKTEGCQVSLGLLGKLDDLKGDAAQAARAWTGPCAAFHDVSLDDVDLVIAAIFGAGLARDIEGEARATILRLNEWTRRTHKPIVAVDVPSGIDGTTGKIRGVAIEATQTVTFFRLKPGHLLLPGRNRSGEIVLADIGIPDQVLDAIAPKTFINRPPLWAEQFPRLQLEGNKYGRGHAVVVSGPLVSTGAARLAARGALRAGAGLVTVATPAAALAVLAAALEAVMTRVCDGSAEFFELLSDARKNAVIMGPGMGVSAATAAMAATALARQSGKQPRSVVLDADALTSFAGNVMQLATAIHSFGGQVVITPHDGEFARLFDVEKDAELGHLSQADALASSSKLERARAAAAVLGAVVILKGADTVVASPDGRASIGCDAPPWLATAGAGDVLAGMTGGLLAQSMPAFEAASAAVWMHGEAARLFGPGLIAEDIPESLPSVLRRFMDAHTQ
ncbi:MAG TPA: NAD(P)H-hydrate dehydratase [Methylovirgula sp.]